MLAVDRRGQQLFMVDLFRQRNRPPRMPAPPVRLPVRREYPVAHRQLVLFEAARDLARGSRIAEPPDPELAQLLETAAAEHARRHGWSKTRAVTARQGIRILLSLQDTPGAAIASREVAVLEQVSIAVQPVREILASAGMLADEPPPSVIAWFARRVEELPAPMRQELGVWFEILRCGSTQPPRFRPRAETTVRGRVHHAMPAVRGWAEAGHASLREITRDHVIAALPESGSPRSLVGQALRSLFRVLKARRLVFSDPTAGLRTGRPETREPMPVPVARLRAALNSEKPARAVIAGLVGFHGLRSGQLRGLQLTDIRDGRLHLPGRTIVLAAPVRERVAAWLDYRGDRWPDTINPHLLINISSGVRLGPVSHVWINTTLGMACQAVREDRILHEATATGDVRRLCDLFGLSVKAAQRYAATLDHPGLSSPPIPSGGRDH